MKIPSMSSNQILRALMLSSVIFSLGACSQKQSTEQDLDNIKKESAQKEIAKRPIEDAE
jgi:hypothetical protein